MWKSVLILSLLFIQFKANAQLFKKYSLGISGVMERGIRTPQSIYYSTPMIYGGNLLLLTETSNKRFFSTIGIGFTQYYINSFKRAPSVPDPMAVGTFLPKSSMNRDFIINHFNVPLSIGYRILTSKKLSLFASLGADLRFQVASKLHYVAKDSTDKILVDRTETNLPDLKKMYLFNLSIGMEYRSLSGRWIYRIEPFIKVDSRKFFKSDDTLLNEFLSYGGAQISCFYQLNLKNKE